MHLIKLFIGCLWRVKCNPSTSKLFYVSQRDARHTRKHPTVGFILVFKEIFEDQAGGANLTSFSVQRQKLENGIGPLNSPLADEPIEIFKEHFLL